MEIVGYLCLFYRINILINIQVLTFTKKLGLLPVKNISLWVGDRCKITALKGFLYTDGPFRAVSRTVQIFNNMGRQKSRQNFTFL